MAMTTLEHDERLFTLNRERDAKRAGNPALTQRITFVWFGELSLYDAEAGGFRIALGPRLTPTRWGVVRFKCEDLPSNLVVKVSSTLRDMNSSNDLREASRSISRWP